MKKLLMIAALTSSIAHAEDLGSIDLSVIPEHRCGVWAVNVAGVVNSNNPMRALELWSITYPQDGRIIQLTYDYIHGSDVMTDPNPFGKANSDCLRAERKKNYGT